MIFESHFHLPILTHWDCRSGWLPSQCFSWETKRVSIWGVGQENHESTFLTSWTLTTCNGVFWHCIVVLRQTVMSLRTAYIYLKVLFYEFRDVSVFNTAVAQVYLKVIILVKQCLTPSLLILAAPSTVNRMREWYSVWILMIF